MLFLFMNSTYIRTEPNPEKSVRAETRNEVSIAYALRGFCAAIDRRRRENFQIAVYS